MPKPIYYISPILTILAFCSIAFAQHHHKHENKLINESSPYLLQHAYNPVNWYPWGEDALNKAKKENKPIIISIGYAACHWCHVMEKESFEDDSVAKLMNEHFVSIKVDREERPDIDQIYIDAAQMINGRAGWPLNCITLPDGKPFFAGTYFPKDQWMNLLTKVHELWISDKSTIEKQAAQITAGISGNSIAQSSDSDPLDAEIIKSASSKWLSMFDKKEGGYLRAPKFPMPANIETLYTIYKLDKNHEAFETANLTLTKMANGGIYDQIGGGFARYSTDGFWKVPHFEKMLYDNGQLLSLYSKGYQVTNNPLYQQVVDETVSFMKRELLSDNAAFYSSLDADSEGEEGKFYVWSRSEIIEVLGEKADVIIDYFQVTQKGNWEHGKNILLPVGHEDNIMKQYDLSKESLQKTILDSKKLLLTKREERVRPGLDDKILTSWNALAIIGLADAYRVFQNEEYLKLASETASFISKNMMKEDFRLDRNYKNGRSSINGFLDDYAFTISAFINMYQVTFNEQWLHNAKSLTDYVIAHFSDVTSDFFFYTSDLDPALITRKIDNIDNVIPSANSEMAINLFLLGNYFYNDSYLEKSAKMMNAVSGNFNEHISSFVNWFHLAMLKSHNFYEVAIVGKDFANLKAEIEKQYLPHIILMGGASEGSLELLKYKLVQGDTRIYVCKDKLCKLPVSYVGKAILQLSP